MKLNLSILNSKFISTRRRAIVIIIGLALAALSVFYTWTISQEMRHEDELAIKQLRDSEHNAVEMLEDILRSTRSSGYIFYNTELLNKLAEHTTVPIVIADDKLRPLVSNLPVEILSDPQRLRDEIMEMSRHNKPVVVSYHFPPETFTIYYGMTDYSTLVSSAHSEALSFFPYVQLIIIVIFAIFAYIAFMSTKQNEQNRVWVGLAKETAHQLGTPTSSRLGWIE